MEDREGLVWKEAEKWVMSWHFGANKTSCKGKLDTLLIGKQCQ